MTVPTWGQQDFISETHIPAGAHLPQILIHILFLECSAQRELSTHSNVTPSLGRPLEDPSRPFPLNWFQCAFRALRGKPTGAAFPVSSCRLASLLGNAFVCFNN